MEINEKSIWCFKRIKEETLSNENLEIILNIAEINKFEMNINIFKSGL